MELLKAVFEEKCILMHLTPSLRQVHVEEKMKTKEIIKKYKQHQLHAITSSILLICPLNNNSFMRGLGVTLRERFRRRADQNQFLLMLT